MRSNVGRYFAARDCELAWASLPRGGAGRSSRGLSLGPDQTIQLRFAHQVNVHERSRATRSITGQFSDTSDSVSAIMSERMLLACSTTVASTSMRMLVLGWGRERPAMSNEIERAAFCARL